MASKTTTRKQSYIERAQGRLDRLERDIEAFRRGRQSREPTLRHETDSILRSFRNLSLATSNRLSVFAASGEGGWSDLQAGTERAMRDMAELVQRLAEGFENGDDRSRYLLSPEPQGGWQLKRAKATRPAKRFASKAEALGYARRYVRGKRPSELLVRRRDGTFAATHRYD